MIPRVTSAPASPSVERPRRPAMKTLPILALLSLPLVACSATGGHSAPPELTTLYDEVALDGAMELEMERDGTFLELEADVPLERVPETLMAAFRAAFPEGRPTGAEREVQDGVWTWEVKFVSGGRAMEIVLDEGARILEVERELTTAEAPAAVLTASEQAVPGSVFVSVESIEAAAGTTYHVKRTRGEARYKIVLSPDGAVLRKVREVLAEIEIPLAD